jgi:hypothetical protein
VRKSHAAKVAVAVLIALALDGLIRWGSVPQTGRKRMRKLTLFVVSLVAAAATVVPGASASAPVYTLCKNAHPVVRFRPRSSESLTVAKLDVREISCPRAAVAVHAGSLDPAPGGAIFKTAGFSCRSPVGPPIPATRPPRAFVCTRGAASFKFTLRGYR